MDTVLARELQPGDALKCVVLREPIGDKEIILYPTANDSAEILTLISICEVGNCTACSHVDKPTYTFIDTVEKGHVRTLTVWSFTVINR